MDWHSREDGTMRRLSLEGRWDSSSHKKGKKDNGIIQEYSKEEKEHFKILFIYYESKLCGKN